MKSPERLTKVFGALSNMHRLKIFGYLVSCCKPTDCCGEQTASECVGDLGKKVDIAPSTLSHHLKELCNAGVVRMNKKGRYIECSLDPEILKLLEDFLRHAKEGKKWKIRDTTK